MMPCWEAASPLVWTWEDPGGGPVCYLLADETGPLAQLTPPGVVASLDEPARNAPLAWAPTRFMRHAALALAPSDGQPPGSGAPLFVAFGVPAWRALAGRAVPTLADGPLRLTFPPVPDLFSPSRDERP